MANNPFAGKLILVADDEPRMIRFIQTNLELDGFRVISAPNGLAGRLSGRSIRRRKMPIGSSSMRS